MVQIPTWLIIDIRHRLEKIGLDAYSLREKYNENPTKCITTTAMLCALPLLALMMLSLRPAKDHAGAAAAGQEWFYDLNTGKLFPVRAGIAPPVESPSGPLPDGSKAGVRAYVFKYENDPNQTEMFVGFLETTASKKSGWFLKSEPDQWEKARLIKRVEDTQWYPADSNEGQAIREALAKPDMNGRTAKYCRPTNEQHTIQNVVDMNNHLR